MSDNTTNPATDAAEFQALVRKQLMDIYLRNLTTGNDYGIKAAQNALARFDGQEPLWDLDNYVQDGAKPLVNQQSRSNWLSRIFGRAQS